MRALPRRGTGESYSSPSTWSFCEKRGIFPTVIITWSWPTDCLDWRVTETKTRGYTRTCPHNGGVTVFAVSGYLVKNTKAWLPNFLSVFCSHLSVDVLSLQKHQKNPDVNESRVCNEVTTFRGASIYAWPLFKGFAPCYAPLSFLYVSRTKSSVNGEPALRNRSFADLKCWTLLQRSTRHRIRWKVRWFR